MPLDTIEQVDAPSIYDSPDLVPDYTRQEPVVKPEVSFTDAFGPNFAKNFIVNTASESLAEKVQPYDPFFAPTLDPLIPIEYQDDLLMSRSSEEYDSIKGNIEEELQAQELLSQNMVGGMAGVLAAGILDPTNIMLGPLAELSWLNKGTRLAKVLKTGGYVGLTNAAQEEILRQTSHTKTVTDVAVAGITGLLMGGAVRGLTLGQDAPKIIDAQVVEGLPSSSKLALGENAKFDSPDGDWLGRAAEDMHKADFAEAAPKAANAGETTDEFLTKAADVLTSLNAKFRTAGKYVNPSKIKRATITMGQDLRDNPNGFVSMIGRLISEHAAGTGGKEVRTATAGLYKSVFEKQLKGAFVPSYAKNFLGYAKAEGIRWRQRSFNGEGKEAFDTLVMRELNANKMGKSITNNPHVKQMVKEWKYFVGAARQIMKESGVEGAEHLSDPFYFPRKWSPRKMLRYESQLGDREVVWKVISKGLQEGTEQWSEEIANKIARAIHKRFINREIGAETNVNSLFRGENKELLREVLKEGNMSDKEVEGVFSKLFETKGADAGKQAHLKEKLPINLDSSYKGVSVIDLLSADFERNAVNYIRSTAGWSSLSKVGISSPQKWNDLIRKARDYGSKNVELIDATKDGVEQLELLKNALVGIPAYEDTVWTKASRELMDWTYIATLGGMGTAQLGETGQIVALGGFKAAMENVPFLRKMRRNMLTGKVNDELIADLESTGYRIGDEDLIDPVHLRSEEVGLGMIDENDVAFRRMYANAKTMGKNLVGLASGQYHIMSAQQKLYTRILVQDVYKRVTGKGGKISAERLADIGFDEKRLARVGAMMKKHATVDNGRLVKIGLAKWTDKQAVTDLLVALERGQNQAIQKSVVGEQAKWMTGPVGRMFTQFRSFPLVAWEKQTLRQAKLAKFDTQTAGVLFHGFAWATAAYYARTWTKSLGLEERDRKKYLETRLSAKAIATGGLALMPQMSVVPDVVGYIGSMATGENPMSHTSVSRTGAGRALDIGVSDLSASLGYGQNVLKSAQAVGRSVLTDHKLTKADWRAMHAILPLNGALGFTQLYNLIGRKFKDGGK